MSFRRCGAVLSIIALLSGCGGGGGTNSGGGIAGSGGGGTNSGTAAGCSLRDRQNWAAAQLREWYLFPETLPASLDPGGYNSVQAYIDALTATARSQGRDRFFTYVTSIAGENAFYASGNTAGFAFRLSSDATQRRVFVTEAFENGPSLNAGIDRGTEILAIGANASSLRTVGDIIAAEGVDGISNALGANTVGTSRVFRVSNGGVTRDVTLAKADYALTPVSSRYGAQIINDGGRQVGYVNLRTFISTADPALRNAFANFRAAGITEVIVDVRYNGGGLVSIAELFGDLLGRNRATNEVFSYTTYRPEKSAQNQTSFFAPQPQSVAPTRIAFIGTEGTASASELVINSMIPYLRANLALVGSNTYGKPVGQIALDRSACDDRLRVIAFATQNVSRQGNYFTGLAGTVDRSCQAADDVTRPLGDPQEASTRAALDFLAGRSCTAISGAGGQSARLAGTRRVLISPERPDTAQREVPGLF